MSVTEPPIDAQTVTAVSAVAISVFSLFTSIAALAMQWRHDRKSVQPIPQIILADYEDRLTVAIENAGIGPLIIKGAQVLNVLANETKPSVIAHMPELPSKFFWKTFVEKIDGRAIPAQKSLILLELVEQHDEEKEAAAAFDELRNQIRMALGYLSITLIVSDIYGSQLPACTRSLDWFHRLLFGGPNKVSKSR